MMTCVIDYDNPEDARGEYSGSFKIKNDPKVSRFSTNNILYCGSRLFSEAMIGIVLFNGQNTKIFRQNMINNKWYNWPSSKKHLMVKLKTSITLLYFGWAMIISISNWLLLFNNRDVSQSALLIEGNTSWFGYLKKSLLISVINITLSPLVLFLLIDISLLMVSIMLRVELSTFCRRRRLENLGGGSSISSQDKQNSEIPSTSIGKLQETPNTKYDLTSLKYPDLYIDSDRRKLDILHSNVNSPTHSALANLQTVQNYQVYHIQNDKTYAEDMDTSFRIFNIDTIFNMANVDHVVFDKTDTITYGSLKIERMATFKKDYLFELSKDAFSSLVAESKSNQARFLLSDSDDSMQFIEDDGYSEESQE